jgi:hypothetical protein
VSQVSDAAAVHILMADYAAVDSTGKLNVIGGGVTVVGSPPAGPGRIPLSLIVWVVVPPQHYGANSTVEVTLEDDSGEIVTWPSGSSGEPELARIVQQVRFPEPNLPRGSDAVRGFLPARLQFVVGFPGGLALAKDRGYRWRVTVDDQSREDWTEHFVVVAGRPTP